MSEYLKKIGLPDGYTSEMSIKDIEIAIKYVKDIFEVSLAQKMNLTRVSAPLFLPIESGLNDNLNGVERPVQFDIKDLGKDTIEIVQSLAKWKRAALKRYEFSVGEGLYTDMNAIRRDEDLDNLHSVYVDQWDWEKVITKQERTIDKLKEVVNTLYATFKEVEVIINSRYPQFSLFLPEEIFFITTQELEDLYPELCPKERENMITKEKKAVFIAKIGSVLNSGIKHDGRAPDYDDWELNGDIVFYHPVLNRAFEVSSMGIRVDEEALLNQLKIANCEDRKSLQFHKDLLEGRLPYTVGGGIGQSRLCMFYLRKAHVGEVQASVWPKQMLEECENAGVKLL